MAAKPLGHFSLERIGRGVEKGRGRARRGSTGGRGRPLCRDRWNAVASWVAKVDEAAVRNTQDVDILLRRADLESATRALTEAGFVHRHVAGVDLLLDGPKAKA